jgi:hypothetical protein
MYLSPEERENGEKDDKLMPKRTKGRTARNRRSRNL